MIARVAMAAPIELVVKGLPVGAITVAGTPITLAPGQSYSFDGGVLRYQLVQNDDFYGTEVRALQITLFEENVVLTLGQSAGRIFFK